MKVLFVSSGNNKQGHVKPIIRNQGESLIKKGIDLDFFSIKASGLQGYLLHIPILKKQLISNKYTLIHAHYGLCGIIAFFAKKNERLVVSFMGDDLIGGKNINGQNTLIGSILKHINIFFARHFYHASIVKSGEMHRILERKRIISAIVPNGINLETFQLIDQYDARKQLKLKTTENLIIWVSDPSRPEKNHKLAEEAFVVLKKKRSDVKLVELYDLSQDTLTLYYNAASVLLLTSFHEGSPNVIKEAMACNCPIVSTDVGDVKYLVNGLDGCYIVSYDPLQVAEGLEQAIAFSHRTNGRQKLIQLGLDEKSVADKIIDIYKQINS